jgi:hypothetical protein
VHANPPASLGWPDLGSITSNSEFFLKPPFSNEKCSVTLAPSRIEMIGDGLGERRAPEVQCDAEGAAVSPISSRWHTS